MNFENILSEIEKVDPEVYERLDTRRSTLKRFKDIAGKLSLAAIPMALGSMFNKAYSQTATGAQVVDILNYALTLEYLEAEFYKRAVTSFATIGVPAGAAQMAITTIRDHEVAHVNFLRTAISGAGGTPVTFTAANFDFTAGNGSMAGPFANVFTNYNTFLAVAQTFEDTGVRAYKGRAAELVRTGDVLSAALRIHSVEARHAAHIRLMRKANNFGDVKPWITGNQTGIGAAVQASYNGEENTVQAGVQITGINGLGITAEAASESFDEGLTPAQVLAIVDPFII
ncbi:ferritin-like domain-containing protein [Aridibaculum aurantiacum]|uniref:ferritin-like domain-containing protein n=1 Tax=Aridibaculum aurantiacum TaxID=2810307 RepID=UPI001A9703CB|nr:ferritin-like domain-containing protein [Aridibaculum aurantiacum]